MRRRRCIGGHERAPAERCPDSRQPVRAPSLSRTRALRPIVLSARSWGPRVAQREEDHRQHPRFCCSGNAEIRSLASGLRVSGRIENLSLGGCRIRVENPRGFREAERVEMTFCVRQLPLRVQASIRQLESGHTLGVAFTLLSERGKVQLGALIEELAETLRDQVDTLAKYQSAEGGDKDSTRLARGPVPIDRDSR
ncbi:MAG TPA: PilZ domain-containing protein [Acidobacteriaceae bacterium]|nr:PilZ domain-containing protein [Acidobacteriaceae bacterium]